MVLRTTFSFFLQIKLAAQISEGTKYVERLQYELNQIKQEADAKDAEIEEKQCLATSYYNALEVF